jgi:hypothetical protein
MGVCVRGCTCAQTCACRACHCNLDVLHCHPVDKCPTTYRMTRQMVSEDITAPRLRQRADETGARRALWPRLPVVELFLLLMCHLKGADAAKNRGWLPDGQLVRGKRPSTRSGYGLAVIADADLAVVFGGDVQGSKHLCIPCAPLWISCTYVLEKGRLPPGELLSYPLTCGGDTSPPRGFVLQDREMMCTC